MTITKEAVWLRTGALCDALGISSDTLRRRQKEGFLREGTHCRRSGPDGKYGFLWNYGECEKVFGTWKAPKQRKGWWKKTFPQSLWTSRARKQPWKKPAGNRLNPFIHISIMTGLPPEKGRQDRLVDWSKTTDFLKRIQRDQDEIVLCVFPRRSITWT